MIGRRGFLGILAKLGVLAAIPTDPLRLLDDAPAVAPTPELAREVLVIDGVGYPVRSVSLSVECDTMEAWGADGYREYIPTSRYATIHADLSGDCWTLRRAFYDGGNHEVRLRVNGREFRLDGATMTGVTEWYNGESHGATVCLGAPACVVEVAV